MSHTTVFTIEELKSAMAETNALFCEQVFGRRNFDALDHIYTRDARILPPGAVMISGRKEIKNFWAGMIQSANARSAELFSDDVLVTGDGAVEIGHAVLTLEPSGQSAVRMEAKYVVFWREEDRKWKWHIDIWNSNR